MKAKIGFVGNDSGTVTVIAALGMTVFLGFAALGLDIAHMLSVKRELTKAAEAGALSGARGLWPVDITSAINRDPKCDIATSWALAATTKNQVDGSNLAATEVTVEVGRWDYVANQFTPGINSSANSVRVTTRRSDVQMMFSRIFGVNSEYMSAQALAVMDFAGGVGKGTLPIAVNQDYAQNPGLTIYIGFNPDPEDNGGWFAAEPDNVNAKTLKDYIKNDSCPPLNIGDTIDLTNGVVDSALQELKTELATHPGGWDVLLPVVDTPKFNHEDKIDAFVPVRILEVQDSANPKYVKCQILTMGEAASALPGGGNFGALAPPKLLR